MLKKLLKILGLKTINPIQRSSPQANTDRSEAPEIYSSVTVESDSAETAFQWIVKNRWKTGRNEKAAWLVVNTTKLSHVVYVVEDMIQPGNYTCTGLDWKVVANRWIELASTYADIARLWEYEHYLRDQMRFDAVKKWIGFATTVDEIAAISSRCIDPILESVKVNKWERLVAEAFATATCASDIVKAWKGASVYSPHRSATVAFHPGWGNDQELTITQIKEMAELAPHDSAVKIDATEKWLKVSHRIMEALNTPHELCVAAKQMHPAAKHKCLAKWDKLSLVEVKKAKDIREVTTAIDRSPEKLDAHTVGFIRWSDLSLAAVAQASTFNEVVAAVRNAPDRSEAKYRGYAKGVELAATEAQIRCMWNMVRDQSSALKTILSNKLEKLLG